MEKMNELVEALYPQYGAPGSRDVDVTTRQKAIDESAAAIAEAFRSLQRRAEAAEAMLAELERQEPVAYTDEEELKVMRQGTYADMFTPHDSYKSDPQWIPLFTRPAPAINLEELVPDEIVKNSEAKALIARLFPDESPASPVEIVIAVWGASRDAMLRSIEEKTQ